ncbi:MAG: HAD family hydrolase [Patescibacteria group bacterium]
MIKAFIFDLDNCIFDNHSISDETLEPLLRVVDDEIARGTIPLSLRDILMREIRIFSPKDFCKRHNLPLETVLARAIDSIVIPDVLSTYGDHEVIAILPGKKFLVTAGLGVGNYQNQKIDKLGIRQMFEEVHVTGDKGEAFAGILERHNLSPRECVVLGDNPYSELAAGKELGMITVQTLRPKVERVDGFDHYIETFHELPSIIARYA